MILQVPEPGMPDTAMSSRFEAGVILYLSLEWSCHGDILEKWHRLGRSGCLPQAFSTSLVTCSSILPLDFF